MSEDLHTIIHGNQGGETGWRHGDPFLHQWSNYFDEVDNPSYDEVIKFRDSLAKLIIENQNAKVPSDIPWRYPKPKE